MGPADRAPTAVTPEPAPDADTARRASPPRYASEDRRRVLRAVLPGQGSAWRLRFAVMLGLSVVIAVTGLLADSPAIVIGAMLIAPLMAPVLGFALSLAMGWAGNMARAATTVALASAGSILLAWLLAALLPSGNSPLTHEVVSRTAPSLLDLLVALAAGAAGAYATVREDVSAALPGVAVAVALVPPLATVGVVLRAGQAGMAKGALLLYLTNLVAIVLAGVAVFLASGFVPIPRLSMVRRRVAAGTAVVATATLAVGVLLSGGLRRTVDEATTLRAVNDEVVRWLGSGTDLELRRISMNGADVIVELAGSRVPPPTSALADALVPVMGSDASVRVRWSQRTSQTAPVGTPGSTTVVPTPGEAFRSLAEAWLRAAPGREGSEVVSLGLEGDALTVEVGGTAAPPSAKPLAAAVAAERGRKTEVTVRWVPRQEFASSDGRAVAGDAGIRARQAVDAWARSRPGVVVLGVSVASGAATVDLAAEATPAGVDTLVASIRAQTGLEAVVRVAALQRLSPPGP